MRLSRVRRPASLGMNMTPMIDIVFLLIIFFMTVSQITRSLDHPIDLPDVGPGGEQLETVTITINMDASGQMIVAGKTYDLNHLIQAVRTELARADNNPSRLRILVRCDRNCPGESINRLGQRLGQLGITRIRLSVQGQDGQQ